MKLLFDNNVSHRLVARIQDLFPQSIHVMTEGLDEVTDQCIWNFAKDNEFTIVTKDSDFNELALLHGFPPQVIWIRIGNCTISDIEKTIRNSALIMTEFHRRHESGILEIN